MQSTPLKLHQQIPELRVNLQSIGWSAGTPCSFAEGCWSAGGAVIGIPGVQGVGGGGTADAFDDVEWSDETGTECIECLSSSSSPVLLLLLPFRGGNFELFVFVLVLPLLAPFLSFALVEAACPSPGDVAARASRY